MTVAATGESAPKTPDRSRRALWAALGLILVWGANFSVQKAIFQALSPGGFLFVRYLIMPVAAAILLCARFGTSWPRVDRARRARAAAPRTRRPPAARRPRHVRHLLVDRVLELDHPRLRPGLHAA